jgi:hypothetical protein
VNKLAREISEEEKKLAAWANQKFKDSMTAKEDTTAKWLDYMNAYDNSLYEDASIPSYRTNEVSNFIYSTIESMRPIMFDGNPKFQAIPVTAEAKEFCHDINRAFDYEWDRSGIKELIIANSIYTLVLGTSIIMLPYLFSDMPNSNVDGDVTPIAVNPFNLYPDPLATTVEDAEYIIHATYQHVNKLKETYPEYVELLRGSDIQYSELVNNRNEGSRITNQVLVLEVWCRDYTTIEAEEEDGTAITKMKYPNGRVIICAPELNIIFEDKENPYETGRFPFFLFKDIELPFQFWGEGEVKWLLSPQQSVNDLYNQVIDNAKHTANMQWVVDKNAGIPAGQLTNRPGLIIRKNPGSEVRRDSPPSMPMYVSEMIERLKYDIKVISGVYDVTRGENPTGIESGTAILALQEAAQTRMRLKITLHEQALCKLGNEWLARIQQFWKMDRCIPIQKPTTSRLPQMQLNGVEMQPQMQNVIQNQPITTSEQQLTNTQFDFITISKDKQLSQSYKVKVIGATGMLVNRSAMFDTMLKLLATPAEDGMPVVTRECVLEYLPEVNKDIILAEFNKLKQEQMMQQQQEMLNNQNIQQLQMLQQQVGEVGAQTGALSDRAAKEDEAKARDEIMSQGYQQGMNEALATNQQIDKSGAIPKELMQQMADMDDNELSALLQQNPELATMI